MSDVDAPALAAWVRSKHKRGKHAVVFVDGYDPVDVTRELMAEFADASETSKVDFLVGTMWVCVRVMVSNMPSAILTDPKLGVCTISPG